MTFTAAPYAQMKQITKPVPDLMKIMEQANRISNMSSEGEQRARHSGLQDQLLQEQLEGMPEQREQQAEQREQQAQRNELQNRLLQTQAQYAGPQAEARLSAFRLQQQKQAAELARVQEFQKFLTGQKSTNKSSPKKDNWEKISQLIGGFRGAQPAPGQVSQRGGAQSQGAMQGAPQQQVPQQQMQGLPQGRGMISPQMLQQHAMQQAARQQGMPQAAPQHAMQPGAPQQGMPQGGRPVPPQMGAGGVSQQPVSQPGASRAPSQSGQETVINQGNPELYKLDEIALKHPEYNDLLAKQGFKIHRQVKQSPETGQVFEEVRLPSGKTIIKTHDVGRAPAKTAAAIERAKGIAKGDIGYYNKGVEQLGHISNMNTNLKYISDVIDSNPKDIAEVIGPWNSQATAWFGTDRHKELLGNLKAATGYISLEAAKQMPGAFTRAQMGLIKSMKPLVGDRLPEFIGKTKGMMVLGEFVEKRISLATKYIRQGMNAPDAIALAKKQTNFKEIKKRMDHIMNNYRGHAAVRSSFMVPSKIKNKDQFRSHFDSLSPEQQDRLIAHARSH